MLSALDSQQVHIDEHIEIKNTRFSLCLVLVQPVMDRNKVLKIDKLIKRAERCDLKHSTNAVNVSSSGRRVATLLISTSATGP